MKSHFSFNGSYNTFRQFAEAHEGAELSGNALQISSENVRGTVIRAEVEKGLSIFDWSIRILQDHSFLNNFSPVDDDRFYLLTYYYDRSFDKIVYREVEERSYRGFNPCLVVMSDSADVEFFCRAGTSIECFSIAFTHSWLLAQLIDLKEEKLVSSYLTRVLQSILIRPLSKAEIVLATELSKEFRSLSRTLIVKSHIYNLLSFLYRHASINARRSKETTSHAEVMIEVEKELVAHLSTAMPSLEALASRFYLSASTLSRHFKATFGTSLSEYYIQKKLDLAKTLLQQNKSVNEVAYMLGYESVSHFIVIFKKYFGYSPGKENRQTPDAG